MSAETKLVQVVKEGDSLFGKAFAVIKEDVEYVIAEIKTEFGKIEKVFHRDHIKPIQHNAPSPATADEVNASGVALETAPTPVVSAPAATTAETTAETAKSAEPEGQPAP